MERPPRLSGVESIGDLRLLVRFENGIEKVYDCQPLLGCPEFRLLGTPTFFRAVNVDPGGYGISWNDDLDLSEYELWVNGKEITEGPTGTQA
jgi:hypothetical protein